MSKKMIHRIKSLPKGFNVALLKNNKKKPDLTLFDSEKRAGLVSSAGNFLLRYIKNIPSKIYNNAGGAIRFPYTGIKGVLSARKIPSTIANSLDKIQKADPRMAQGLREIISGTSTDPISSLLKSFSPDKLEKIGEYLKNKLGVNQSLSKREIINKAMGLSLDDSDLNKIVEILSPNQSVAPDIKTIISLHADVARAFGDLIKFIKTTIFVIPPAGALYLFNQLFLGGGVSKKNISHKPRTLVEQLEKDSEVSINIPDNQLIRELDKHEELLKKHKEELSLQRNKIKSDKEYISAKAKAKKIDKAIEAAAIANALADTALVSVPIPVVPLAVATGKNVILGRAIKAKMDESKDIKRFNRKRLTSATKSINAKIKNSNKVKKYILNKVVNDALNRDDYIRDYAKRYNDINIDIEQKRKKYNSQINYPLFGLILSTFGTLGAGGRLAFNALTYGERKLSDKFRELRKRMAGIDPNKLTKYEENLLKNRSKIHNKNALITLGASLPLFYASKSWIDHLNSEDNKIRQLKKEQKGIMGILLQNRRDDENKLIKSAKVRLQPHQRRVSKRMENTKGLLLFHSLGSGKTISSINAAKKLNLPLLAIVPASLRNNFEKEIKKIGFNNPYKIISYTKAISLLDDKDFKDFASKAVVIFDEAHKMGRIESKRSKILNHIKPKKVLMLTGTPVRNRPEELLPLIKALGAEGFPTNVDEFKNRYIKEKLINPSFWGRFWHNAKAGIEEEATNLDDFKDRTKKIVDFYESFNKNDYPSIKEEIIEVPMSWRQNSTYQYMIGKMPELRYKLIHGIPPNRKEKGRMAAFLTGPRQASNTPELFSARATSKDANKIQLAANEIEKRFKKDKNFKAVSYSNFLDAGVRALGEELKKRNIPYAYFTGELNDKKKKKVIENYNSGKVPVLLISRAGVEGLDLKGTKLMQILEPHWHEEQIKQVKGRAIRYKSHSHLPENERLVEIQRFHSIVPKTLKQKILNSKRDKSVDEYLYDMSQKKEKLNLEFLKALAKGSIEMNKNAFSKLASLMDKLRQLRLSKNTISNPSLLAKNRAREILLETEKISPRIATQDAIQIIKSLVNKKNLNKTGSVEYDRESLLEKIANYKKYLIGELMKMANYESKLTNIYSMLSRPKIRSSIRSSMGRVNEALSHGGRSFTRKAKNVVDEGAAAINKKLAPGGAYTAEGRAKALEAIEKKKKQLREALQRSEKYRYWNG